MSLVYARSVFLLKRTPISTSYHVRASGIGLVSRSPWRTLVTTPSPLIVLPGAPSRSARTKSRPRFLSHPEPRDFDDYDLGADLYKEQKEMDEQFEERLNRPVITKRPRSAPKQERGPIAKPQKARTSFVDVDGRTAVSSNKVESLEQLRSVIAKQKAAGQHPEQSNGAGEAKTKTKGRPRKSKPESQVSEEPVDTKSTKRGKGAKKTSAPAETEQEFFDETGEPEPSSFDGDPIQANFHEYARHGERDDVVLPREIVTRVRKVLDEHHYSRNQSEEYMERNFHLNYLANRMTNDILILTRLLKELARRAPKFAPQTILDISAKTGAGLWAVDSVYGDLAPQIVAVENTPEMLALGKKVTADHGLRPVVHWEDAMNPVKIGTHNLVISNDHLSARDTAAQRSIAEAMWNHTKDVLIIVEPGSKEGFAAIRNVRQHLLDRYGASDVKQQPTIIAPCPHGDTCPMTESKSCFFRIRVPRVNMPRQSWAKELKPQPHIGNVFIDGYSYLIVHKGSRDRFLNHPYMDLTAFIQSGSNPTELTDPDGKPTSAAAHLYQETDSKNRISLSDLYQRALATTVKQSGGDEVPKFDPQPEAFAHMWSRMISPPLKRRRHIILDVCAADGQLHRNIIPKKFPVPKAYSFAKDSRWGDQWPYPLKPTRREQKIAAGEFRPEWDQRNRELRDDDEDDEYVDEDAPGEGDELDPDIHSVEDIEQALKALRHRMDPKQVKELESAISMAKARAAEADEEGDEDEDGDEKDGAFIDAKSADRTLKEKEPAVAASLMKKKKKKTLRQQQAENIEKLDAVMRQEEELDGGIAKQMRRLKMRTLDEIVQDEERLARKTLQDIEEDNLAEEFEREGAKYRARSARKYRMLDEFEEVENNPYFDETAGVPRMPGETHQEHLRRVRKEAEQAEREFLDIREKAAEVRASRKERKAAKREEQLERKRERERNSRYRVDKDDEDEESGKRKQSEGEQPLPDEAVPLDPELETMLEEVTMGMRTEEDMVAINVMYANRLKNSGAKLSQDEEEFVDEMAEYAKMYHLDPSKIKVRPLKYDPADMPPAPEPKQSEELPSKAMGRRKSVRDIQKRQHKISLTRIKQHEPDADIL